MAEAPAAGQWLEVAIPRPVPYRYVKFESGAGTAVRLAEIRFLSATGELPGEPFGTNVPKEQADTAHPKAFDDLFRLPRRQQLRGAGPGRQVAGSATAF